MVLARVRPLAVALVAAAALCGCGGDATGDPVDAVVVPPSDTALGDEDVATPDSAPADTETAADTHLVAADTVEDASEPDAAGADTTAGCPLGHPCNPVPIGAFPYTDHRDTAASTSRARDAYGCAPDTNEGGAEVWYALTVSEVGVLTVAIDDVSGDGVDVDVHLLDDAGDACLARDNRAFAQVVRAGSYRVVADTWVDSAGVELPGPYTLTVTFQPLGSGPCAVELRDQRMFWSSCAAGVDCFEREQDGATWRFLRTPAYGPVVHEAHLVTTGEDFPGNGWPTSARDQIDRHYALSQAATGYVMDRATDWAPFGEGGSQWGQGAVGAKLPVLDEAWYVNMYWKDRPAAGTRLLVLNPDNGRAVVAAGGYETGPGSNTAIGGAVEEIHHHLGTDHRDPLVMGYLVDQTLPLGPVTCAP